MTKKQFIESYVTTFLATYAANMYVETAMNGTHNVFNNQPIEDAYSLAEKAWKAKEKILAKPSSDEEVIRINKYGEHQYNRGSLDLSLIPYEDWKD